MFEKLKIKIIDIFGTAAMAIMIYLDDIVETILTVVGAWVVAIILTNFFIMPVQVNGTSMYPTLYDGELGFSSIIAAKVSEPERFDIVVIKMEDSDEKLVKRIIGLPGETISCVNDCIYIDGSPLDQDFLDEDYVLSETTATGSLYFTNDFSYTLGEDEYFALGDNRLHSLDSRYYGGFKREQIIAINIFCIYPFELFGEAE